VQVSLEWAHAKRIELNSSRFDYWMADMNGLAVALELKRINSNVPLVMFSGFRCILDEALGRVDEWLIKGETRPADLLRTISKLLSRNGQCEA
jgi:hypothetical protein